ncbi:MAG: DUF615 domain-containing protein [Deltaproteobacteria bacterium]|nr:DUF615 domain-containing protein [Deltaproteobacteria bacterium]
MSVSPPSPSESAATDPATDDAPSQGPATSASGAADAAHEERAAEETAPSSSKSADAAPEELATEETVPSSSESAASGPADAAPEELATEETAPSSSDGVQPPQPKKGRVAPEQADHWPAEFQNPDLDAEQSRGRPTAREHRAESNALWELAKSLVEMKPPQLATVSLPAEVVSAVEACRGFRKNARIRELRRISTMLRRLDVDALTEEVRDAGKQRRRSQREQVYEQWRERLVAEGDRALTEFVDQHPMADPQRLRQLLRQARRSPGSGKSKQALRSILRLVREALEVELDVGGAGD